MASPELVRGTTFRHEEGEMAGAGAERPAIGLGIAAVEDEGEGGAWAVDRRQNGNWTEVERFGSQTKAQERLDEIARARS